MKVSINPFTNHLLIIFLKAKHWLHLPRRIDTKMTSTVNWRKAKIFALYHPGLSPNL